MNKTTMMLAIMSAIIATGLAVSTSLATPVFAQSASSTGASTDFGSASSAACASFFSGGSGSTSSAGGTSRSETDTNAGTCQSRASR